MKPALKISVLLNVVLLGLAAWLLRPVPPPVSTPIPKTPPPVAVAVSPFSWSRLESTNYLTYIANLRAIGCPSQTIRDLITADVDGSLYAPKRERLRDQEARSGQNLESRRQELAREESSLIARLLGLPLDRNSSPANAVASAAPAQPPPTVPLAFLDPDTNFVQLDERQQTLIGRLRQGFMDELGGQGADPNSPEYAERWRKAQPEYDEMLESWLGPDVFIELQREAWRPVRGPTQAP